MAPLTWRNVDAPSFAASNDLLRYAGQAFNTGFDALGRTVDDFKGSQIDNESNRLILDALRYGDSDSLNQALTTGKLGGNVNPSLLTPQALNFLAGRERDLIGNDQASSNLTRTDIGNRSSLIDLGIQGTNAEDFYKGRSYTDAAREYVNNVFGRFGNANDALKFAQSDITDSRLLSAVSGLLGSEGSNLYQPPQSQPEQTLSMIDSYLTGNPNASAMINNESGGNFAASNDVVGSGGKVGHYGRGQFSVERLEDAKRAGVMPADMTPEQFLKSPDTQIAVENWAAADIDRQASEAGLEEYYGQTINGVTINRDSIRAMAHLGGFNGAKRFIESGGSYNPADDNGTKLSDYGSRFGGAPSATTSTAAAPIATSTGSPTGGNIDITTPPSNVFYSDLPLPNTVYAPSGSPLIGTPVPAGSVPATVPASSGSGTRFADVPSMPITPTQASGPQVGIDIPPTADEEVVTDPSKLTNILANKLKNTSLIDRARNANENLDARYIQRPDRLVEDPQLINQLVESTGMEKTYISNILAKIKSQGIPSDIAKYLIEDNLYGQDPQGLAGFFDGIGEFFTGEDYTDQKMRVNMDGLANDIAAFTSIPEGEGRLSAFQSAEALPAQVDNLRATAKLAQDRFNALANSGRASPEEIAQARAQLQEIMEVINNQLALINAAGTATTYSRPEAATP